MKDQELRISRELKWIYNPPTTIMKWRKSRVLQILSWVFLSKTECYNCIDCFIEAVNFSKALYIPLPQTPAAWECVRHGFTSKSSHQLMSGYVDIIDDLLAQTIAPREELRLQMSERTTLDTMKPLVSTAKPPVM